MLSGIQRVRLADVDMRDLRDLADEAYKSQAGDAERLKASLTLRLHHLDDRSTRLTDLLIDGGIDQSTFNARKENLLMERQGIAEELQRANRPSPLEDLFQEFERNNHQLIRYETLLDDEKRELIDIVCSNFSILENNPVFTLRAPYKEIAEIGYNNGCGHHRDDVRTKRIFDILKNTAFNVASQSP